MRLGFVLIVALLGFAFTAGPAPAADFPMQAKQVAPNVYAVITPTRDFPNPKNRGWNSNSAFVVTGEGVILFDTGSSAAIGHALKAEIRKVADKPVRWVINSHSHGDHWLGNAVFRETAKAIYASGPAKERIEANGDTWVTRFDRMTSGATGKTKVVPPDTVVKGPTDLVLGGVKVTLFLSGNSHTPDDVIMWLPESKVLVSGDVVYSDRMPSTGESNMTNWMKTLDRLIALGPAVVVPGHGKVADAARLKRLRDLLQAYWNAVEKEYKAGKLDYQMTPDVTAALGAYAADFPGLEEKVKRDIQAVFLQVEDANFR
ncbi:MAG: MBL fold metallo-hydrolase [Rhodospirillaceae bacterium]